MRLLLLLFLVSGSSEYRQDSHIHASQKASSGFVHSKNIPGALPYEILTELLKPVAGTTDTESPYYSHLEPVRILTDIDDERQEEEASLRPKRPPFGTVYSLIELLPQRVDGAPIENDETEVYNPGAPPIGASYSLLERLPIVGKHKFYIKILSPTKAYVKVEGTVKIDEVIPYKVRQDGTFDVQFSSKTLRALRFPFFINIRRIGYNMKTDTPYIDLSAPAFKGWHLELCREKVLAAAGMVRSIPL